MFLSQIYPNVIVFFEVISFCLRTISADRTHIEHSGSILDEGASLDGDVDLRQVFQTKVDEGFEFVFAQEVLDRLFSKEFPSLETLQAVLRKCVVDEVQD